MCSEANDYIRLYGNTREEQIDRPERNSLRRFRSIFRQSKEKV